MIERGVDANAAQGDGTTALHWAVYRNDTALAKALLAHGARASVRNNFGVTPLIEAVKVANEELVRALLKAGADTESTNDDDQTALMVASKVGAVTVVQDLLRHGANVNAREKWRGQTALMWAAASDHPEVVELLIRRGADVHARAVINDWGSQVTSEPRAQYRPTGGMTALLYATRTGCERCVDAMLKAKADIDLPTPDGITPLMVALDNQNFALARHLLDRGANPHIGDWWGRTALYIATDAHTITSRTGPVGDDEDRGQALDLMRRLLDAGVDPNPQLNMHRPGRGGNSGRFTDDLLTIGATPLLRAALSFDDEAIRLLLERGALVDLPNGMGVTPLMAAAGFGTSIRDIRGSHTAPDAEARSIATMKILIAAGADVNARVTDTSGHTARIARPSAVTDRQGQTAIYGADQLGLGQRGEVPARQRRAPRRRRRQGQDAARCHQGQCGRPRSQDGARDRHDDREGREEILKRSSVSGNAPSAARIEAFIARLRDVPSGEPGVQSVVSARRRHGSRCRAPRRRVVQRSRVAPELRCRVAAHRRGGGLPGRARERHGVHERAPDARRRDPAHPVSTPRLSTRARPWSEPSATTVWGALTDLGLAERVVLWNCFAWHPHRAGEPQSNRTPTREEYAQGLPTLAALCALYPRAHLLAVGKGAAAGLASLGRSVVSLRHPRWAARRPSGPASPPGRVAGRAEFRYHLRSFVGLARRFPRPLSRLP